MISRLIASLALITGIGQGLTAYDLIPVQLAMPQAGAPRVPPVKRLTAPVQSPPHSQGGLTAAQQGRLAEALQRLTPAQRKRLAKVMKHLTPDQRNQLAEVVKRHLEGSKTTTPHLIQRAR
jgi:hypothetical protein